MKKVLVADDEDALCQLYAKELRNEGYEVITTNDGAGLIKIIKQHKPDLIVLDIRMDEYNGLDLLQDIRNTYYNTPVILCKEISSWH
ncbi:MAG: response regulator [Deltaproteobacteria bacterium]|nr:response regulator [Deltaproteobacteria bacterium]MBW2019876.1 response regulator [Deltaproteobacteria bacterium]MBW2074985.1 response regulator [Deltaproteobacteria bacterium]RLB82442.1 MAG: response regulator [Deltaproteobacteria bacterium]